MNNNDLINRIDTCSVLFVADGGVLRIINIEEVPPQDAAVLLRRLMRHTALVGYAEKYAGHGTGAPTLLSALCAGATALDIQSIQEPLRTTLRRLAERAILRTLADKYRHVEEAEAEEACERDRSDPDESNGVG